MDHRIEGEGDLLGTSLWNATAPSAPHLPALEGEARADVAIVGAGFTGLSAALHLAEQGVSVLLLEARTPGWGASGRNGGQIIPGLKEDPDEIERRFGAEWGSRLVDFTGRAPDLVFGLIDRFAIDCDAVRSGWIQPAHDSRTRAILERRVEQWKRRGAMVSMLERAETARLIGSGIYDVGALDRRGGSLHPLKFSRGLAEAAIRGGVVIHARSPVQRIRRQAGAWELDCPSGVVRAEQVLLCTNAYSTRIHESLRRSVVPVCSIQVASEPLPADIRSTILPEGHVASDMRRLMFYFRLSPDGRLVIGGRGAYRDSAVAAQMQRLRRAACKLFPQIGDMAWPYRWGGFVAMTPDHLPHIHEPEPGLSAAVGYNGRGVAMATALGKVLADKATGIAPGDLPFPQTSLHRISLHRFHRLGVEALIAWNGLRDRLDHWRS